MTNVPGVLSFEQTRHLIVSLPMLSGITIIALAYIFLCAISLIVITTDIINRPQGMPIMNIVWPVTALYAGPIAILACEGMHDQHWAL